MITINSVNLKASIVKGDSGIINVSNWTRHIIINEDKKTKKGERK